MTRRIGRPTKQRRPDERVPVSMRLRGDLFNKLANAAADNDRPLANEVEIRLEMAETLIERLDRIEEAIVGLAQVLGIKRAA